MRRRILWVLLTVAAVATSAAVALAGGGGVSYTNVPAANSKAEGYAPASVLSPELWQTMVAQGSMALDGAQGNVGWYGYINDAPSPGNPALPQMIGTPASPAEAQKTEPDKNTYLVLKHQTGADPNYDYGTHFLFQGHEVGAAIPNSELSQSYITRINLDADVAHRVTLLATRDSDGHPIQGIDGSTWDPWSKRLLFTTEDPAAPTYAATATYPSTVTDVSGALGRGGYEGIQVDSRGEIWIVEDVSGPVKGSTKAKQPNSFLYRYVPKKPGDLAHGKLQVLQVWDDGHPVTFASQAALNAPDQVDLRTYGTSFRAKWVTIHDTATDGNAPFDSNALAKAADGTPFKRPENGQFRPGSGFKQFFFDETGDTNADSPENGTAGGWTSIFKLVQRDPASFGGRLSLFYQSKSATVAGLDNVTFLSRNLVTFVEDAGDGLHGQRNALDSGFIWDVTKDYSTGVQPVRWLAEGRDPSATLDSATGGFGKNEGDNEITGVHVSNGNPGPQGLLGAEVPNLWNSSGKWRWFYTQQHGDNFTWQVELASHG
jgi:Alkaline phosphatase PhoX